MPLESISALAAKPLVDGILKSFLIPTLKEFCKSVKSDYDKCCVPLEQRFCEYLVRNYEKYSVVNTLVFKNQQRLLKEIYVPLRIYRENEEGLEKYEVNSYPKDVFSKYKKLLIIDTAGMGKSTLTKYIFLDIIDHRLAIPIFIELRRLSENKTILQEIQEQVNSLSEEIDNKLLLYLINKGSFIFFLDGFDEIPIKDRSFVTTDIRNFIDKAGRNLFMMTSRPEQSLSSFGDFQQFSIMPLEKKEAFRLLKLYDVNGNIHKRLISELKSDKYKAIDDFLRNPLLVSLLFAAYDYKQSIPLKKHLFYRQVYNAYFDQHDLSKGDSYMHDKRSNLDIDDFDRVMRYIGFQSLKNDKIEFDYDQLINLIDRAKDYCSNLSFSSSDFIRDLISAVPLFCRDGLYYKWVHKSLQEYFAATFIYQDAKNNQDIILSSIYKSDNFEKYTNLLDIYYDVDNLGFSKNILKPLCKEYVSFFTDNFTQCGISDRKAYEHRIGILFDSDICILNNDSMDFGEVSSKYSPILESQYGIHPNINHFCCNLVVFQQFHPIHNIISLLISRKSDLLSYHPFIIPEHIKEFDGLIKVSANTFSDNLSKYVIINKYMSIACEMILDYEKCCAEIEKIDRIIENNENSFDITSGF